MLAGLIKRFVSLLWRESIWMDFLSRKEEPHFLTFLIFAKSEIYAVALQTHR